MSTKLLKLKLRMIVFMPDPKLRMANSKHYKWVTVQLLKLSASRGLGCFWISISIKANQCYSLLLLLQH